MGICQRWQHRIHTLSSSSVQVVKISKKLDNFSLFKSFFGDMPYCMSCKRPDVNYIGEYICNELGQTCFYLTDNFNDDNGRI